MGTHPDLDMATTKIENRLGRGKVRKGVFEQYARAQVEKMGGIFLHINWKKKRVHYLTKTGAKETTTVDA